MQVMILEIQAYAKPSFLIIASRKLHSSLSKAFDMSNLMDIVPCLPF